MVFVTDRPGWDGDITEHFDLVWTIINRLPDHVRQRIEDDDAFQAGVIGLMNAKRLYDPARGKWSTFAWSKARWNILIAAGLTRKGWAPLESRLTHRHTGEDNDRVESWA